MKEIEIDMKYIGKVSDTCFTKLKEVISELQQTCKGSSCLFGKPTSEVKQIDQPTKRTYRKRRQHKTWTKTELDFLAKELKMAGFNGKVYRRVGKELRRTEASIYMKAHQLKREGTVVFESG